MNRRLWLLLALPALAACDSTAPGQGAAKAVINWSGFAPGCLRLSAGDGQGHEATSTLKLADAGRSGHRTVAVYRAQGWSSQVVLVAQALEGSCEGKVVARSEEPVRIASGRIEASFDLTATDEDQDGFVDAAQATYPGSDCDDSQSGVHPRAQEQCNDRDDDCDGQTDEEVRSTFYPDTDGDGFGDPAQPLSACTQPQGYVAQAGDCDDAHKEAHPDGTELCDGLDNDCDGQIDEGFTQQTFYADADEDGFGSKQQVTSCQKPPKTATNDTDCDDQVATVFPGANEVCNGVDDDCDGTADDGVTQTFFHDVDQDGYGSNTDTVEGCARPEGYVLQGGDCDDADNQSSPAGVEVCDGKDNDCDATTDEGVTLTFYQDLDGDGSGDSSATRQACAAPSGYVASPGDCDDADSQRAPGQSERCDDKDNDCNGTIDEGVTTAFYLDSDQDGFGDPSVPLQACAAPTGYVANASDCNDAEGTVNPSATEVCNGLDDDCNGSTDEGVTSTFYADTDGDGHGALLQPLQACAAGPGRSSSSDDCDDGNFFVHPAAAESCDALDNDCANGVDDGNVCATYSWKTNAGSTGGGNHGWRRVAPSLGGAWVVGADSGNGNGKLRFVSANNQTVTNYDGDCGNDWYSVTTNASGASAWLGNASGVLARHDYPQNSCGTLSSYGSIQLAGHSLLQDSSGNPFVEGVNSGGDVYQWDLTTTPATLLTSVPGTFFDAQLLSDTVGYAVGSHGVGPTVMPFIIHATSATTWAADTLPPGLPAGAELRSVSVAPGGFAAAVGDQCVVLFREPGASGWTAPATMPTNCVNLLSVAIFGRDSVYVGGTSGTGSTFDLWRWDGSAWTQLPSTNLPHPPRDLRGLSPSDLWVVGSGGMVLHWSP